MTPQMNMAFGPVRAEQLSLERPFQRLLRKSRLVSVLGGETILDAELSIVSEVLPEMLLLSLSRTSALFGQLLLDHRIAVSVALPQLFQTREGRFGRKTTITQVNTGQTICDVTETMSSDARLTSIAVRHGSI